MTPLLRPARRALGLWELRIAAKRVVGHIGELSLCRALRSRLVGGTRLRALAARGDGRGERNCEES